MPTGYTCDIKKGINFKEYAMGCARAFGALVEMRDQPFSDPIPKEFEPSNYHNDMIQKLESKLEKLKIMGEMDASFHCSKEWSESDQERLDQIHERKDLKQKYESMLAEAKNWAAPSSDHDELKTFMIKQIEESIKFDCSTEYYDKPAEKLSGEEWLSGKKQKIIEDINYHKSEQAEENLRVKDRNKWVALLRKSLS